MKTLNLDCKISRFECDFGIYKDLSLPMIMLQGWFNDQHECLKLYFDRLTPYERRSIFKNRRSLESARDTYEKMWSDYEFMKVARRREGEHKWLKHLKPGKGDQRGFCYWAKGVFEEAKKFEGLEAMVQNLETVEEAHHKFNPWFYSGNPTRGLNAADAARVLARYGYLRPESRPLLARGALRGAAIVLDGQPYSKNSNSLEREYADEEKRVALEQKAADYIVKSGNFSGDFQMEEGESWFCEVQKNLR